MKTRSKLYNWCFWRGILFAIGAFFYAITLFLMFAIKKYEIGLTIYWAVRVPRLVLVTPFWTTSNFIPLMEATMKMNLVHLPSLTHSPRDSLSKFEMPIVLEGARRFYYKENKEYPSPRKNIIAYFYFIGYLFLLASMIAGVCRKNPDEDYLRYIVSPPLTIGSIFAIITAYSTLNLMRKKHKFPEFEEYPRAITMVLASTTTAAATICNYPPDDNAKLWGGTLLYGIGQLMNMIGGLLLSIEKNS